MIRGHIGDRADGEQEPAIARDLDIMRRDTRDNIFDLPGADFNRGEGVSALIGGIYKAVCCRYDRLPPDAERQASNPIMIMRFFIWILSAVGVSFPKRETEP